MERMDYVRICKCCKLRGFDKNKGVICSLTNDIANFQTNCDTYDEDRSIKKYKIKLFLKN